MQGPQDRAVAADPDPDDASPYREQIARFRTLSARSHSFAAVVVGSDHRFFLANPAFDRLVASRPIIGLPLLQALPELSGQERSVLLEGVLATGEAQVRRDVELSLRGADGSTESRRLDIVCQPIADDHGAVTAIFLEETDVTERFMAGEALRTVERRNRQILDSAVD